MGLIKLGSGQAPTPVQTLVMSMPSDQEAQVAAIEEMLRGLPYSRPDGLEAAPEAAGGARESLPRTEGRTRITDITVTAAKERIEAETSAERLVEWSEAEKAGKDRTGVQEAITARLEALSAAPE